MQSETSRIEAFSDGVFAIAITLLILEIKTPAPGEGPLSAHLAAQWPSYIAFLMSFAFIGIMWINHHRLFTHIKKSTDVLLVLNLLLLLGVTAVPFPTAVLAAHLARDGQRVAAVVYNGTYVVVAVLFNVLWRYAVSRELLDKNISGSAASLITRQYAFGPLLYLVCFVMAWISVPASLAINGGLAIFFALPPSVVKRRE